VFNASFNNISSISWWPLLLVEDTRVPGENHRPAIESLTNLMLHRLHLAMNGVYYLAVKGTDCRM